jgi:ubiquinone/menaquinone biosynthesis C-methylase UbiE
MAEAMKHGDFSSLAGQYAKFRPGYALSVLRSMTAQLNKPLADIDFVDVGAGTGIWTRIVAKEGVRSVRAVEPNGEMRAHGEQGNNGLEILWSSGQGEKTGLLDSSCDFLTMASSFHWVNFEDGVKEFSRVLRPGCWFAALWNTRFIEKSPILVEIEQYINKLIPNMKRFSSGRSEFCDDLTERLIGSEHFEDALHIEGFHLESMSTERYIGIWESVNDIRVQAGEKKFQKFLDYLRERISSIDSIDATYLTRAWMARTKQT